MPYVCCIIAHYLRYKLLGDIIKSFVLQFPLITNLAYNNLCFVYITFSNEKIIDVFLLDLIFSYLQKYLDKLDILRFPSLDY